MTEMDPDLTWLRQTNADKAVAWAEDAERFQKAIELLERQALRIVELNQALAAARAIIEQQKKAIAMLRSVRVDDAPGPGGPGDDAGDRGGDGAAE